MPDDLVQARLIVDRLAALGVEQPGADRRHGRLRARAGGRGGRRTRASAASTPVATKDLRDDPDTVLDDAVRELADMPPDAQPDAVVLALARDRNTAADARRPGRAAAAARR